MRRRELLAALGLAGTGGCVGLFGEMESAETLTPAPVPAAPNNTETPTPASSISADGPRIPADAAVYVYSTSKDGDTRLRLVPDRSRYGADRRGLGFTLTNRTSFSFLTGRDRWTLARRTLSGWTVINRGDRTDIERVQPGETFRWVFSNAAAPDSDQSASLPRLRVAASGGHALAITGSFPRGELIAVVALFDVLPDPG